MIDVITCIVSGESIQFARRDTSLKTVSGARSK